MTTWSRANRSGLSPRTNASPATGATGGFRGPLFVCRVLRDVSSSPSLTRLSILYGDFDLSHSARHRLGFDNQDR